MSAQVKNKFRIFNARQFSESFSESVNSSFYVFIGKTYPWTSDFANSSQVFNGTVSLSAPAPLDDLQYANLDYQDMLFAKKVSASDVSHVVPRNDWLSGTVYSQYVHNNPALSNYYVLNSANRVYKCISNNNGGTSTIEPTSTSSSVVTTGDSYQWKYLFTLSNTEKFKTPSWHSAEVDLTVSGTAREGAIHNVIINAGGSGYSNGIATWVGDGTNFAANITVNAAGSIVAVTVNNVGANYHWAQFSNTNVTANILPIISPPGGHGFDPIEELNAKYVMLDSQLEYGENAYAFLNNDYRKIGLLVDPLESASGVVALGSRYDQRTKLNLVSKATTGTFLVDELIRQQNSNATGRIVTIDSANTAIYVADVVGLFTNTANTITGITSSATANGISTITAPGLTKYSGDILYIDYRDAITRTLNQIEDIKIVISF